jgi:8-oxo-dGTP diphosphatase
METHMNGKPFSLSVKMIVRNESGCCLLLKRSLSSKGNTGKWEFPGGKTESGETFTEALLREVKEETGLTISLERVAGAAESELPTRKVAYLIMEGRWVSGEVHLSNEHDAFAWVSPEDVLKMEFSDQFQEFIQRYFKKP